MKKRKKITGRKKIKRKRKNPTFKTGDRVTAQEFINNINYPVLISETSGQSSTTALNKIDLISIGHVTGTILLSPNGFYWHWKKGPNTRIIINNKQIWEKTFPLLSSSENTNKIDLKPIKKITAQEFINSIEYPVIYTYGPGNLKSPPIAFSKRTLFYRGQLMGTVIESSKGIYWYWRKTTNQGSKEPDERIIANNKQIWENALPYSGLRPYY